MMRHLPRKALSLVPAPFWASHPYPHSRKAQHPSWKGSRSQAPMESGALVPQRVRAPHCKVHGSDRTPILDSELSACDTVPLLTDTRVPQGELAGNSEKVQINALPRNSRSKPSKRSWEERREHLGRKARSAFWGC